MRTAACGLCGGASSAEELREAGWLEPAVLDRVAAENPGWRRADGACPACVQEALLRTLLEKGEAALHDSVQRVWPLDASAALGAIPTPLRLHADPRFTGRGVTVALVDSAFYPHPDLVEPRNRIRAWVDASGEGVRSAKFGPSGIPRWPGWSAAAPAQWHGLMTSTVAAGNGALSHGLYRGLAPDADLVLVQVQGEDGRAGNEAIVRALRWLEANGPRLGVRVVNLSLGGDPVAPLRGNPVDEAVAALARAGMTVVAAAGNDARRRLVPPGTAPDAITVGGIDDRNTLDHEQRALWHGSYGETAGGVPKPEVVAPSLWVVAPVLPGTIVAREAPGLFEPRAAALHETRIAELKLVTPHYQHVEGTSFAAPVVAGTVACMLEANPGLGPRRVRDLLVAAAHPVPGAPRERQGAGAVDAGRAVTLALADRHGAAADYARSPVVGLEHVRFLLHEHRCREVRVLGSWNGWSEPGLAAVEIESGLWEARLERRPTGRHAYKFLLDGREWLADAANPVRTHDGRGGWNSVLEAPPA